MKQISKYINIKFRKAKEMINKIKNNVPLDDITKSYNKHKNCD